LALNNVQLTNAGNYAVVVSNAAGSVTSAVISLIVWAPVMPVITTPPQSQTNAAGSTAVFGVVVSGTVPLSYQWRLNGTNIDGATSPHLIIATATFTNAGYYDVVVYNTVGSVVSTAASLAIVDIEMLPAIRVYGPLGADYSLQSLHSLTETNWNVMTNVSLPSQPFIFIDFGSPTNNQHFYRAVPW